ncbi:MAG: PIG-P-domain-containing protein [Amphiamblys sp. WSBS2006]|nr:MAG: PIG-P-domain-containing protein [Amphiamblys sp. WSBS2006]
MHRRKTKDVYGFIIHVCVFIAVCVCVLFMVVPEECFVGLSIESYPDRQWFLSLAAAGIYALVSFPLLSLGYYYKNIPGFETHLVANEEKRMILSASSSPKDSDIPLDVVNRLSYGIE